MLPHGDGNKTAAGVTDGGKSQAWHQDTSRRGEKLEELPPRDLPTTVRCNGQSRMAPGRLQVRHIPPIK